ncbi:MAG TPA: 3-oxoacyl-[acyl-carrier-protein] reductase [Bacteroidetes bacterium]|jgi:3-oxoacyl-[acyl-carrier protein] reductase|nr:3-oxoacyl-[acyl-carrier-protein] reductase [Bacteroidota bacterium]
MGILDNKVALVTGGARGIGRAIALAFAGEGAQVAFTDIRLGGEADDLAASIRAKGVKAMAIQSDVRDFASTQNAVDAVEKEMQQIDILVNNAGITRDNLLIRMSEEEWDAVIDTNLKGTFNFCKAACRQMLRRRQGKIINIASVVGLIGNAGQVNYSASKAGIIGLTKSLAKEFGSRNIQVNAVAPGFVDTEMTEKLTAEQKKALTDLIPLKRTAKAHEIAAVVKFLASSEADYITGQVICVDGGLTM